VAAVVDVRLVMASTAPTVLRVSRLLPPPPKSAAYSASVLARLAMRLVLHFTFESALQIKRIDVVL
jgi:hypothetical protein